MSIETKNDKLKHVTKLFDQFVGQISGVQSTIDEECKFTEGYLACLKDIFESINDKDDQILSVIRTKIDMDSRKELLGELSEGLSRLNKAYNDILKEE